MIPNFEATGLLPIGIHETSWEELYDRYSYTPGRKILIEGLYRVLVELKNAGCKKVFVDGSFITNKMVPGDFDGCWDPAGVNPDFLDPVLLDFSNKRRAMKVKYFGEMFISVGIADRKGNTFLEFFQIDKDTGNDKGILFIDLEKFNYD